MLLKKTTNYTNHTNKIGKGRECHILLIRGIRVIRGLFYLFSTRKVGTVEPPPAVTLSKAAVEMRVKQASMNSP